MKFGMSGVAVLGMRRQLAAAELGRHTRFCSLGRHHSDTTVILNFRGYSTDPPIIITMELRRAHYVCTVPDLNAPGSERQTRNERQLALLA